MGHREIVRIGMGGRGKDKRVRGNEGGEVGVKGREKKNTACGSVHVETWQGTITGQCSVV